MRSKRYMILTLILFLMIFSTSFVSAEQDITNDASMNELSTVSNDNVIEEDLSVANSDQGVNEELNVENSKPATDNELNVANSQAEVGEESNVSNSELTISDELDDVESISNEELSSDMDQMDDMYQTDEFEDDCLTVKTQNLRVSNDETIVGAPDPSQYAHIINL